MTKFPMRDPCRCGSEYGVIRVKGPNNCVFCWECNAFQYNAPKIETGDVARTVTTVHNGIKPKQRARILERDLCRCVICGASSVEVILHLGHVVSVKEGLEHGLTEVELNNDENLITVCEECNLGQGRSSMTLRLMIAVLKMRAGRKHHITDFTSDL